MGCEVVVQLTRISAAGRREKSLLTLPTLRLRAGSLLPGNLCRPPRAGATLPRATAGGKTHVPTFRKGRWNP